MFNEIEPCTKEEVVAASADIYDMVKRINEKVEESMNNLEQSFNA